MLVAYISRDEFLVIFGLSGCLQYGVMDYLYTYDADGTFG
jgi:hypothetical protein